MESDPKGLCEWLSPSTSKKAAFNPRGVRKRKQQQREGGTGTNKSEKSPVKERINASGMAISTPPQKKNMSNFAFSRKKKRKTRQGKEGAFKGSSESKRGHGGRKG